MSVSSNRLYSIHAEMNVLGSLMLDNKFFDEVADTISEEDFFRDAHKIIFSAMRLFHRDNKPFEITLLTDALNARDELNKVGGELYLFEIANLVTKPDSVMFYAIIVKDRSNKRKIIKASESTIDQVNSYEGKSSEEILACAAINLSKIGEQGSKKTKPVHFLEFFKEAELESEALLSSDALVPGIPSGFDCLDRMTNGFRNGRLTIIAGRPAMGKTSLAMNIVENAAIKEKKTVLVFSMEMSGKDLVNRMISSVSGVRCDAIQTGRLTKEDCERKCSFLEKVAGAKIFIDATAALSPTSLYAHTKNLISSGQKIDLIVIDYLQLMVVPGYGGNNKVGETTEISRSLKALSMQFDVPVIALSQLNRNLENRPNKRPKMADLRDSGAIEQDADLILFVYRDEQHNKTNPDKDSAEIIIGKNRFGKTGDIKLEFNGDYLKFVDFNQIN